MGQIVIDTPDRLKRRYHLNRESVSKLVEFLDSSGVRIDDSKLTADDLSDISAARRARKEESISWEDAKAELGV